MSNDISSIDMNSRLVVNPGLVLREEDDRCALLFDPATGTVQALNCTAVDVWKKLDGQHTLNDVFLQLQHLYDDMDADAGKQVLALVQGFAASGAVGVLTSTD